MSSVFLHATFLAVYFLRAINNPKFVAGNKYLQRIAGSIFNAFVSLYTFLEDCLEGLYF
jgi:hypothetical protein